MSISEICNSLVKELPSELSEDLITVRVEGLTVGLKKGNFLTGHQQVFVLGGDGYYLTLFGVNEKYNEQLSKIAEEQGIHYVKHKPADTSFIGRKKIVGFGINAYPLRPFKEYIENYREEAYVQRVKDSIPAMAEKFNRICNDS